MKKLFLVSLILALLLLPGLALEESAEKLTLSAELDTTTSVAVGESITGTWSASGGTGPYLYDYAWIIDDYWLESEYGTVKSRDTFNPRFGVSGILWVSVKDHLEDSTEISVPFKITGGEPTEPLALTVDASPDPVALDKGEFLTGTWQATGGTGPYLYSYSWNVDDYQLEGETNTNKVTDSFTPPGGESGLLYVYVMDSLGRDTNGRDPFTISGSEPTEPLKLTVSVDPDTVAADKGESFTGTWQASGGTGPYKYNFYWIVDDEIVEVKQQTNEVTDTFKPYYGSYGGLEVYVEDSLGRFTSADIVPFAITGGTVLKPQISIILDKTKVDISKGESIKATATVTGPDEPYEVSMQWYVEEIGQRYYADATFIEQTISQVSTFTPTFGSTGEVIVIVDNWDYSAKQAFELIGGAEPDASLRVDVSADKPTVRVGDTVTVQATASGGTAPYKYDFRWETYKEERYIGTPRYEKEGAIESTDSYRPSDTDGDLLKVNVFATDSLGRVILELFNIPVLPRLAGTLSGDANGDDSIDIMDLVSIIDFIVSNAEPTSKANADANGDGTVDIMDLVWIIDQIVGG